MIINDDNIMVRSITFRNPPAYAILERVHQSLVTFYALLKYKTWYWLTKIHVTIH